MQKRNNHKRNQGDYARRPLEQEFVQRVDGRWNFWHRRYVHGYSYESPRKDNLVWVIRGVYKKVPEWGKEFIRKAK